MGLIELRDYLRGKGEVSATDIARHFDADHSVVQHLAGEWIKRGKLAESAAKSAGGCKGGSCSGCCSTPAGVYYRWLG